MLRTIVFSWLLLMVTLGAVAVTTANWYEYQIVRNLEVAINAEGWEPVPDQSDRFLVRRPRLRLR